MAMNLRIAAGSRSHGAFDREQFSDIVTCNANPDTVKPPADLRIHWAASTAGCVSGPDRRSPHTSRVLADEQAPIE